MLAPSTSVASQVPSGERVFVAQSAGVAQRILEHPERGRNQQGRRQAKMYRPSSTTPRVHPCLELPEDSDARRLAEAGRCRPPPRVLVVLGGLQRRADIGPAVARFHESHAAGERRAPCPSNVVSHISGGGQSAWRASPCHLAVVRPRGRRGASAQHAENNDCAQRAK